MDGCYQNTAKLAPVKLGHTYHIIKLKTMSTVVSSAPSDRHRCNLLPLAKRPPATLLPPIRWPPDTKVFVEPAPSECLCIRLLPLYVDADVDVSALTLGITRNAKMTVMLGPDSINHPPLSSLNLPVLRALCKIVNPRASRLLFWP
jgi:hypothetical protein